MKIISHSFYARDTVDVARDLLGKILIRKIGNKIISGVITETEAYRYKDDPASHAFGGLTERNKAMFGSVGMAYVYFTYGMHYCMNAVARGDNYEAGAVLIRALDPKEGVNFMVRQRKTKKFSNLTNGPAKLTQALQISKKQYGADLAKQSSLFIIDGIKIKDSEIIKRPRIGIKKATNRLWNFTIQN
ncbi:MAG TPA: DNA-3-methyladenine glycosylase [Nitrosopumilaceae archaeon]|nr:DNA-3-methyladenine glycosylase [Nitrosopumilaceae archaeon]